MSRDVLADFLLVGFILGFISEGIKAYMRRDKRIVPKSKTRLTTKGPRQRGPHLFGGTHDAERLGDETRPAKGRDGRVR